MNIPDHHQQHRHQHHQLQEDRQPAAARDLLAHDIRAAIARATAASPSIAEVDTAGPLAGVRTARLARDVAAGQLREQALRARGAGHGWNDIADALGLHDHDDPNDQGCGQQLGELAWEWLIEHRPPPPDGRHGMAGSAVWVCTACRARVRDTGPYAAHPDDRESGHTPRCPRHQAALAAHLHELHEDDMHDRDDRGDRGDAELDPANDISARRRGGALLEEGNGS